MNVKSIRFAVFVSIISVMVVSTFITGIVWYFGELQSKEQQLIEKAMLSLQPIVTLANRNVEGGNLMNLKSTAAQDLYKTNANLMFARIYGTSAGTAATDFADEIPPMAIENNYTREGLQEKDMISLSNKLLTEKSAAAERFVLDRENKVLIIHKALKTTHDSFITAIFSSHELDGIGWSIFKTILGVFILALAAAMLVAVFVVTRISTPIVRIAGNITNIAKSLDLTSRVKVEVKNEIGDLAHWFNSFIDRLQQIMASVRELTNLSNYSVSEISSSVQQQSAIATQQSASLTEITVTVEELSASSSQIADSSNSVAQVSAQALHESESGLTAVENLKSKIEEISEDNKNSIKEIMALGKKSKEIGKIMEIINNIADQTKLIAFNAAIEAASAGEAGKRFGVVAVEIRRLADNVMLSTREIESKIEEIQQAINRLVIASEKGSKTVYEGTLHVTQTHTELANIVERSKAANDAATQISLSTQQQKIATNQVLTALKEIEQGIRQSCVAMRQNTTVVNGLKENSNGLKKLLDEFKINAAASSAPENPVGESVQSPA